LNVTFFSKSFQLANLSIQMCPPNICSM
jgi:hypothetical protein